jgi:hypothetical protein
MVIRQTQGTLRDLLIHGIRLGLIPVAGLAEQEHLAQASRIDTARSSTAR